MAEKQTECSSLEELYNQILGGWQCEIYRRICDTYEETCFSQKTFTNELNMGLPQCGQIKKKPIKCK